MINPGNKEVLIYFKSSFSKNHYEYVGDNRAANYSCRSLNDVIGACKQLEQTDMTDIKNSRELI